MGFKVSLLSLEQFYHNNGVIMSAMASQITSLTIVYSIVYSGTDQRKHCGELIGDRWISRTNGQWRGTCFHLMTSSWCQWTPDNIGMLVTWSWQRTTQTLQQNKEQNKYTCIVVQHYSGAIIGAMASQITSLTIVYATVYSGADQRKHKSSASLAFMQVIRRWPVNSPHKGPVTRKKSFHLMTSSWHYSDQKCAHVCSEWCVVGYGAGASWDLWNWSIGHWQQPGLSWTTVFVHGTKYIFQSSVKIALHFNEMKQPLDHYLIHTMFIKHTMALSEKDRLNTTHLEG